MSKSSLTAGTIGATNSASSSGKTCLVAINTSAEINQTSPARRSPPANLKPNSRPLSNAATLTAAYINLAANLFPLIEEKGLSAAVYTQTTDVEVEVNGLMTYDRQLVKMDLKKVAAANRGEFPRRPRIIEIVPTAQTEH